MKNLILIIIFAAIFSSCTNSFLELDNPNLVTAESFWETEDDFESGVAAIYNNLGGKWNGTYWAAANMEVKDGRTENFIMRHDVVDRYRICRFLNTASNDVSTNLYKNAYKNIFYSNQVIYYSELVEGIDETALKELVAEAKFLRGLNYFFLVTDFGSVPIITKMAESSDDYYVSKSSAEEVWQQVLSDFNAAKSDLPTTRSSSELGRATKGTAIAYLGRAYLYRSEWDNVISELSELINNEETYGYGLLDDYSALFDGEHENSKEAVFAIQFGLAENELTTVISQECAPSDFGWWELMPTQNLLDEFLKEKTVDDDFDPRATATLAWNYPNCVFYQRNFLDAWDEDDIWIKKNQRYWREDEGAWESELDEYAMRYADVLLMYAEALTMNGKVSDAISFVNRIRNRANLVDKTSEMAGWTTDQMMEEIRHQRELEFAREGLHWYDLRRWGILEQTIKDGQVTGYDNFTSKYEYYPIPESELNNNPNMSQNDPW